MAQHLAFDGPTGRPLLVEVEPVTAGPVTRGARREEVISRAGESLEQVLSGIGPAVNSIVSDLRSTAEWPQEVEVEFAIKLSTDANVIIARTGGEANFRVILRWTRAKPHG